MRNIYSGPTFGSQTSLRMRFWLSLRLRKGAGLFMRLRHPTDIELGASAVYNLVSCACVFLRTVL